MSARDSIMKMVFNMLQNVLREGDQLLMLQEDDNTVIPIEERAANYTPPAEQRGL